MSNVNLLLEVILFPWTKGFQHIFAFVLMQMFACWNEHMRVDCFALFAWFVQAALLAGIVKTATGKACNEWKTLGQLGLICIKCSCANIIFQTAIFLTLVVRNNTKSSDDKTSNCLSRNCLHHRYLQLRFC